MAVTNMDVVKHGIVLFILFECVGCTNSLIAIQLQVWTDLKGSRSLRLPEFLDGRHMKVVRLSALLTGWL
jgi:hypothetical protein